MAKAAPRPRKKEKKNVVAGVAHVAATFNNTIVTITDGAGQRGVLVVGRHAWGSKARANRRPMPRRWPPKTPARRPWSTACDAGSGSQRARRGA